MKSKRTRMCPCGRPITGTRPVCDECDRRIAANVERIFFHLHPECHPEKERIMAELRKDAWPT